jgi:hypothetical protein
MIPLFMPRRKMDVHSAVIIALLVGIAGFVPARQALAQAIAYKVTELAAESDPGQVLSRLNNLDDLVGRACNFGGGTGAATWSHGTSRSKHLGNLGGGEYRSASGINDAGEVAGAANIAKSIVPFVWTPAAGLRRIPLLPGDNCGQTFAIINTAMWLNTLRVPLARGLLSGEGRTGAKKV